jgi:hypothetical protein
MRRFVEEADRGQWMLLPECLDDFIDESNPVRVIDLFVDAVDLAEMSNALAADTVKEIVDRTDGVPLFVEELTKAVLDDHGHSRGAGRASILPPTLQASLMAAKIAFTGETTTGRLIMQYASQNLIPVTLELGGKSPNIFFNDVAAEDDDFFDKAIEGFVMFALNQGEVCTCPSRALVHEAIYDRFMERALARVGAIKQDDRAIPRP